jgi:ABC-type lipoprotein export system ATPase subunit
MIDVSGLVKQIIDGHSNKNILDNLEFHLEANQSVAISGDSGSGKSTLLNILAALDYSDKGQVEVAGLALNNMSEFTHRQLPQRFIRTTGIKLTQRQITG